MDGGKPVYFKTLDERFPPIQAWIPHNKLTITKVINTEVTCYLCRGTRAVAIKRDFGVMDLQTCPHCRGSGRMRNTKELPDTELYR